MAALITSRRDGSVRNGRACRAIVRRLCRPMDSKRNDAKREGGELSAHPAPRTLDRTGQHSAPIAMTKTVGRIAL